MKKDVHISEFEGLVQILTDMLSHAFGHCRVAAGSVNWMLGLTTNRWRYALIGFPCSSLTYLKGICKDEGGC